MDRWEPVNVIPARRPSCLPPQSDPLQRFLELPALTSGILLLFKYFRDGRQGTVLTKRRIYSMMPNARTIDTPKLFLGALNSLVHSIAVPKYP